MNIRRMVECFYCRYGKCISCFKLDMFKAAGFTDDEISHMM